MAKVDVLILHWNEPHLLATTLYELEKDRDLINKVIIVDNGSDEPLPASYPVNLPIHLVELEENAGPSVGRNAGLELVTEDEVFMLDCDIVYVPGTLRLYQETLHALSDEMVACVGYNNPKDVALTGQNGALRVRDVKPINETIDTLPVFTSALARIAWTQYGLFDVQALRLVGGFVTEGVFGIAGHGYEDNWLYEALVEKGYEVVEVQVPTYFHSSHTGLRNLRKKRAPSYTEERKKLFEAKYPSRVSAPFRRFMLEYGDFD